MTPVGIGARFAKHERMKELRKKRKRLGLCSSCGKEKDNDKLKCELCLERGRAANARRKKFVEDS